MRVTRRKFVLSSMAGIGMLAVPFGRSTAWAAVSGIPSLNFSSAFAQLARLSFGPTLADCGTLMQLGLAKYLEQQLQPNDATDSLANEKLATATLHIQYNASERMDDKKNTKAKTEEKDFFDKLLGNDTGGKTLSYAAVNEDRPLTSLNKPIEQLWPLADNDTYIDGRERRRPADEVRAATWIRATYSQWQLRELMVDFWHNHFNVNAFSDQKISATFPLYDAIMRKYCFGNFRAFLEDVAQSPAMLFYLNNAKSHASPANENYARELFELHTLGADYYYNNLYNRWREVPGATQGHPIGYIDEDVYEAARAFTGWTIEDGSNTGRGTIFPKTGKFTYFDGWHDNYQKRVLGTEFDPNAPPMEDGHKVLDLLAQHPATAMTVCTKLCRRLVSDAPSPDLVKRAAATWTKAVKAPDQIAQVLRTIILSPEFAAPDAIKAKRPFEYAVSFLRTTGTDVLTGDPLFGTLTGAGQRQFEWPTPTGHPDTASFWLNTNTTLSCWNMTLQMCDTKSKIATLDLAAQTPAEIRTSSQLVTYWFERMTGRAPAPGTQHNLMAFMPNPNRPDEALDIHNPNFRGRLVALVTSIAMLPEFAVRG